MKGLQKLKNMCNLTKCFLNFSGYLSESFNITSGIRQGASSSVIMFIIFMDNLIKWLNYYCIEEPIIGCLHALLHADDTLILSTSKTLFINKCEAMLGCFNSMNLDINKLKSSYMIINADVNNNKLHLTLSNVILEYKLCNLSWYKHI